MRLPSSLALLALLGLLGACGSEESKVVKGNGYSFEKPTGWEAESIEVPEVGAGTDVAVLGPTEFGFRVNINVVREPSISPQLTPEDYARLSLRNVRKPERIGLPGTQVDVVRPPRDADLGGEPAVAYEFLTDTGVKVLRQRQTVAIQNGAAFTVTYSATKEGYDSNVAALTQALSSWDWD